MRDQIYSVGDCARINKNLLCQIAEFMVRVYTKLLMVTSRNAHLSKRKLIPNTPPPIKAAVIFYATKNF